MPVVARLGVSIHWVDVQQWFTTKPVRLWAQIDPLGFRSTTVYDVASRPVATIDPLLQRTTTTYFADGKVKASINAFNQRTTNVYDLAGRPEASVDALGRRTTTAYNTAGQAVASIDALGKRSTRVYRHRWPECRNDKCSRPPHRGWFWMQPVGWWPRSIR